MTLLRRRLQTIGLLAATLVVGQSSTGPVLSQPAAAAPSEALRSIAAASLPTGRRLTAEPSAPAAQASERRFGGASGGALATGGPSAAAGRGAPTGGACHR